MSRAPVLHVGCTMSVQQFRKPASARQANATAAAHAAKEAEDRAQYTTEVLARYRDYVQTKLEPELEELKDRCSELEYEATVAQDEAAALRERLVDAEEEATTWRRAAERARTDADGQIKLAASQHADHIIAVRDAGDRECSALRREVDRLTDEVQELRSRGFDPNTAARLAEANDRLETKDAELRTLRRRCDQQAEALAEAEGHRTDVAPLASAVNGAIGELRMTIREAAEFSGAVASAFAHIDVSCPEIATAAATWRGVSASADGTAGEASMRALLDALCGTVAAVRHAARDEHTAVAAGLKLIVLKHTDLLERIASGDHERQHERELTKRRLAELEEDRRAEKEALLVAAEKERAKAMLTAAGGAAAALLPSHSGGQQPQRAVVATSPAGVQTGAELMGAFGDQQQAARLMNEIAQLQADVAHYRETVQLLERQRRKFMSFVDDEQATTRIRTALQGGGISSTQFMLDGV